MRKTPGSPHISKRQFICGVAATSSFVAITPSVFAQNTRPGNKTFDTYWSEFGGYAGIIRDNLKTDDPKILAFVRREGDKFIANGDPKKIEDRIEIFGAELGDLFGHAKSKDVPVGLIKFFETNAPQLLVEFIPYSKEYPALSSLGRRTKANQDLQRATQELERAKELNRRLGGQRP